MRPSAGKDKLSARAIGSSECLLPQVRIQRPAGKVWEDLREQIHLRGDELIGQHLSKGGAGFGEIPIVD
ncbi:MAG: hypothetical protein NTX23_04265 [Candidatus Bipolaricaulota bacterium]|nr:hypothetical protein [Candidatus Bipolaricaulota bacterium]